MDKNVKNLELAAMYADGDEVSGVRQQKRRLGDAIRKIIEGLVVSNAPEDELSRAADAAEGFVKQLDQHRRRQGQQGYMETSTAGNVREFFDDSPVIGAANPLAPPLRLRAENGEAHGTVKFGWAYEGPPGFVHGGYIAAIFDELLGFTQSFSSKPGMTGTLTIRYRSPTPLNTDLRLIGSFDGEERRKVFASGKIYAGDVLTAEAEGIFINIGRERFQKMAMKRAKERK